VSTPDSVPTSKPLLDALLGRPAERPPIWLMRQAGRYLPEYREVRARAGSFLDLCYAPELATEVTLQPVRRYALDAAILFSDILVVPDGLGRRVSFREGEGPVLEPITDDGELAALDLENMERHLAPVYETVRQVRAALPPAVTLIGFAGAPWTVATYMLEGGTSKDFATAKAWAYGRPEAFGKLIDCLVEATVRHLMAQISAGAEAVQLFDSWAGVLPEEAFEAWCIEPARRIVEVLRRQAPEVPVIGFPRGASCAPGGYERFVKRTGVAAVGLDTAVPPAWAAAVLQPKCTVQGNLDPILLLVGGKAMEDATRRIVDTLAGGAHVFNLGHGVVPQTPPENVARLVEIVRAGGS